MDPAPDTRGGVYWTSSMRNGLDTEFEIVTI